MTALQQHQPPGGTIAPFAPRTQPVANRTLVSLTEWAEAAKAAHEVSAILVRTPFVPEAYRDNPYAATAAILAGDEVGLSPMASLNAFDVIQGRAAPKAITLRAIVQSVGHEIWLVESSDQRAVVQGRRAGRSTVEESVWTIQRARTMNLTGKAHWKLQPEAMLIARATSECCRLVAADAILGIPYSSEEVADDVALAVTEEPSAIAAAPPRTVQRKPRTAAPKTTEPARGGAGPTPAAADPVQAGPSLPGEDGYDEPAAPSTNPPGVIDEADYQPPPSDRMEPAQQRKLFALLRDAEIEGRDERFAYAGKLLGREITSYGQLSVADASRLIENLEAIVEGENDAAEQVAADDPAGAQ